MTSSKAAGRQTNATNTLASVQSDNANDIHEDKRTKGFATRYFVTFMLFLGMANAYVMRTNMSVAIVAMVNHTHVNLGNEEILDDECDGEFAEVDNGEDGEFKWSASIQGYILASFFYGYVITQIPFGLLAKKYGSLRFLGWGMLINSIFAFVVPVAARKGDVIGLCLVRFVQGLGEGPIVPCTHALLAKWIPPNERSRMGAAVYAGAQFGTIISMPLSGLLAEYGFDGGWPSIFYVFGTVGTIWSIAFLMYVYEDPSSHPTIDEKERKYINHSLWGADNEKKTPAIPFKSIFLSMPFYAILLAHMGHNYGYETLMTELPTYMKQVLRFSLKANGLLSSLPYLAMWLFSMFISVVADWMISSKRFSHTATRKIINSIGQYGPGIALIAASYTGCNRTLTLAILTIGVGFNGGIYSGFKINHLDLTPRFAGLLMAITNCSANLTGLLAPIVAGNLIENKPTMGQWQIVFFIAAFIYIFCGSFYNLFASGERQWWDNSDNDSINNIASNQAIDSERNGISSVQKMSANVKNVMETSQ